MVRKTNGGAAGINGSAVADGAAEVDRGAVAGGAAGINGVGAEVAAVEGAVTVENTAAASKGWAMAANPDS